MIVQFSVSNFRSFYKKASISFSGISKIKDKIGHIKYFKDTPVLKSSAIYGSNGSGKTNLFRGIELLRELIISEEAIGSKF